MSSFGEDPNSTGMDPLLIITGVGSGHRLEGDGKRQFIFVLGVADDKESLEKKAFMFEELDPMFKQATVSAVIACSLC